jgi:ATP-dependent Clp protease ATP-binding subunit ClpA
VTPDLDGFSTEARRAIAAAEREAGELGHSVVGTEHLLLGLLSDGTTEAADALRDAGATFAAARAKVREAVGASTGGGADEPRSASARATRALGRAARFSHTARSAAVTSVHLLQGVLDVEGRAGQVLRGLGVDVDRLRAALDGSPPAEHAPAAEPEPVAREVEPAACASCGSPIEDNLVWRTVTAMSPDPAPAVRDAVVFSCGACGATLGVGPA